MRGCGHTKTGHGSRRQAQNSFKTTSLFDYWQLCNGNGLWNQWTCVTQRGKSLDETELKWLQLPLSPFCLSLSFSSSASASALWWTFSKFQDRMDRDACFISPSSCCYPFHFLVLVSGWQVKLSSQMAAHPSLCWLHYLKREINNRERGRVLKAVILKEAVTLKKSVLTKINNQTNNQTTICSNFKDELLLGALCSFCDFWCHNVFLCF